MMILERVGICLKNVMFNIYSSFLQQVAVVTVYADEKLRVQVFDVFQALRDAFRFMSSLVPGAGNKMESVIRAEVF